MALRKAILVLAILSLTPALRAQATRPAATDPAVDLSTPRAALRSLNLAMRTGDVTAIKHIFLARTTAQERMAAADADMAEALAQLREAAIRAFGAENAKTVTGDTSAGAAQSLARIDAADIAIKGDTATVIYADEKDMPFILKRVDSQWRVPVNQLNKPLEPSELEQQLEDLAFQSAMVRQVTQRIRAGGFSNAEQAREAWQSKFFQPTSQPATRPQGKTPSQ